MSEQKVQHVRTESQARLITNVDVSLNSVTGVFCETGHINRAGMTSVAIRYLGVAGIIIQDGHSRTSFLRLNHKWGIVVAGCG